MAGVQPYNPLDKSNLGKSVVDALLMSEERPLASVPRFPGAGVYAIYYRGNFRPYERLAQRNRPNGSHPIYVGKAIPAGGRKGARADASMESTALSSRLLEHAGSVASASTTLRVEDFSYRALAVDDIWIGLGETILIQRFSPLWNQVVEGFGNHDPGSGRYNGKMPLWDMLHPGRAWAQRCNPPNLSVATLLGKVDKHLQILDATRHLAD